MQVLCCHVARLLQIFIYAIAFAEVVQGERSRHVIALNRLRKHLQKLLLDS